MEVDGIAIRPVVAAMARETELRLREHAADNSGDLMRVLD